MHPRLPLLTLLLLVLLRLPGPAQPTAWHKVALDSVASVELPDSVSRRDVKGERVFTARVGPSLYIVLSHPTNRLVGLVGNNNQQLYDGMVKGWLAETGGQLLHRQPVRVGEFSGVEIQFATPQKPELPATKYTRMVLVNGTVYFLNYWTNADPGAAATAERERFFASFQVSAQATDLPSGAYRAGRLLGRLLVYGLAGVAALVGLIFLVRRLSRSRT